MLQAIRSLLKEGCDSFLLDTTLVGDVPESYITVPKETIPNYTPISDPFDGK